MSNRESNEERGGLLLAKEPSQLTLPLGPRRTGRTATRPRSYQYGTLDAVWQCMAHCPVRSPVSGSVSGTATRPQAFRPHCQIPLEVLHDDRKQATVSWQRRLALHIPMAWLGASLPSAFAIPMEKTSVRPPSA